MATTLSRNLRLRINSALTADAQYNLNRIDTLGGILNINTIDTTTLRSRGDINIEPEAQAIGGSGVGGVVNLGSSAKPVTSFNIYSGAINFNAPISLLDIDTAFSLKLRHASGGDSTADRTLSLDLDNADRSLRLGGNFGTAADFNTTGTFALTLNTTAPTTVTFPTSGILSTLTGTEILANKDITGTFAGPLTGTLTGNSVGIHTGAVTGNVTGDLTGNVTGTLTGNVTGNVSGTASNVTGIVAIANGGTGQAALPAALTALLPSQTGQAGKLLVTNGTNSSWLAAGGGSVTSVDLAAPSEFTVSGNPVTLSGTLTLAKATQTANTIWAGPVTGAAAQPTFRAIDLQDLPGGLMAIGDAVTAATIGSLLFADTLGVLAQDNANLYWDNTNKRLGLGTATPTGAVDVVTSATTGAAIFSGTEWLEVHPEQGSYFDGTTATSFGSYFSMQHAANTNSAMEVLHTGEGTAIVATKNKNDSAGNALQVVGAPGGTEDAAYIRHSSTLAATLRVQNTLATGVALALEGSTSGLLNISVPAVVTPHTLTLPAVQGVANSYMRNSGIGTLSWTEAGTANGLATLDGGGKVPTSQLPSTLMDYLGMWNATTNFPALADGTGSVGDVRETNVAGTQNLGSGNITFAVGDWVVYNGTIWEKSVNSNSVVSVNGNFGIVALKTVDIPEDTNLYWLDSRFTNSFNARQFATVWAPGDGASKTISHGFGTDFVFIMIVNADTGEQIYVDTMIQNNSNTQLNASAAPTGSGWNVIAFH